MTTYEGGAILETNGISPKAIAAFCYPAIATCIAVVLDWVISGQFDHTAIRVAIAGLGASALAALGAWLGHPGDVVVVSPPAPEQLPVDPAPEE